MAVSGVHGTFSTSTTGAVINGLGKETYYIKGSIENILDRCKFYYVSEDSTPGLDPTTRKVILSKAQATAARGLRVIAVAYGYGSVEPGNSSVSSSAPPTRASTPLPASLSERTVRDADGTPKANLVFVGYQAMLDPPRKGVADSIGLLQSGGVQVVMITGDAEETAVAIARSLGLKVGRAGRECLTGQAIDAMTKPQLMEMVAGGVSVFARTTPKHKMAIVEAFQAAGKVVAMTGDGGMCIFVRLLWCVKMLTTFTVNDAPALKMADIGVSMGKSGTDVAKEAADMILVDDNFSTILPAVEEGGRHIPYKVFGLWD